MSEKPTTIGSYLRAARRRRGLSIESASESTRVRAQYLMRMESDEFDFLAPTYVRGFLRSYARFLEVPVQPLLEEFDRRYGSPRQDPIQLVPMDRPGRIKMPRPSRSSGWTRAAAIAAGVFALLLLLGIMFNDDEEPPSRLANRSGDEPRATASPSPEPSATPTKTRTPKPEGLAIEDGIEVEVIARDRCWMEVTADGDVIYSDTLESGLSETFRATDGMQIVFGNPPGVDVIINGRAVTLPPDAGSTITLPEQFEELVS